MPRSPRQISVSTLHQGQAQPKLLTTKFSATRSRTHQRMLSLCSSTLAGPQRDSNPVAEYPTTASRCQRRYASESKTARLQRFTDGQTTNHHILCSLSANVPRVTATSATTLQLSARSSTAFTTTVPSAATFLQHLWFAPPAMRLAIPPARTTAPSWFFTAQDRTVVASSSCTDTARPNHALQRTEAGGRVLSDLQPFLRQPLSLSLGPLGHHAARL